jgi:hypothetical protein
MNWVATHFVEINILTQYEDDQFSFMVKRSGCNGKFCYSAKHTKHKRVHPKEPSAITQSQVEQQTDK